MRRVTDAGDHARGMLEGAGGQRAAMADQPTGGASAARRKDQVVRTGTKGSERLDTGAAPKRITLQRVLTDRPTPVRALYWRGSRDAGPADPAGEARPIEVLGHGGLLVPPDAVLRFDTYFNAFFEQHWRLHTNLQDLRLHLRLAGPAIVRLFRRTDEGTLLLHERKVGVGADPDASAEVAYELPIPAETLNFRQHGMLWFEVTPQGGPVRFLEAAWTAPAAEATPVGLGVVFCTFNREADIARVLAALAEDGPVMDRLARVFVVSQGRPGLAQHPAVQPVLARLAGDGGGSGERRDPHLSGAGKVRIIEQGNFGGAGGFGRGLLEALDDPAVTHVAFLDDDIRIEPDSMLRMASFFALARGDVPVGGHMLDSVQPTRLYEAGAVIRGKDWTFAPRHNHLDIADSDKLSALIGPQPVHYNGWWCFGFPKHLVRREGMPLPCFIRGDDVEFGLRLYNSGVPTVPLPGVAVWHEPFYLKIGGWQLYYETRNMLVAAARHFPVDGRGVAVRMLRHFLLHLLTFRYYSAALILRGIEDFLRGPAILDGPPQTVHLSLDALRKRHPQAAVLRGQVLEAATVPRLPRGRPAYVLALLRVLLRNWVAPTRPVPPKVMQVRDFAWVTLERHDSIALETWWDRELPRFSRSREEFRHLARQGAAVIRQLWRRWPEQRAQWRTALPRLTSEAFWRGYLGMDEGRAETAGSQSERTDPAAPRRVSEPA